MEQASRAELASQGELQLPLAISASELQEDCGTLLRATIAAGGIAAELLKHQPGGELNADTSARGWLRYYQQLHRTHAVLVNHGQVDGSGQGTHGLAIADALSDAGADVPVAVTMSDGSTRFVFPKSYHALRWLDALDLELQVIAREVAALRADGNVRAAGAIASGTLLQSYGVRLWAWIITHRDCDLPFEDDVASPKPPKWTTKLTVEDLLRLFEGHREVNRSRLDLIGRAFPADPSSSSRLPLSGLLGSYANEHNLRMPQVLRRTSLGSIYAQTVAASQSARESREAAKRESGS